MIGRLHSICWLKTGLCCVCEWMTALALDSDKLLTMYSKVRRNQRTTSTTSTYQEVYSLPFIWVLCLWMTVFAAFQWLSNKTDSNMDQQLGLWSPEWLVIWFIKSHSQLGARSGRCSPGFDSIFMFSLNQWQLHSMFRLRLKKKQKTVKLLCCFTVSLIKPEPIFVHIWASLRD